MEKSAAVLLFASFLFAALLGPVAMTSAGGMQGDCPFANSGSLCPSSLPGALHHLSAFGSFLAVTVAPFAALLFMLAAVVFVLALLFRPLLLPPPRSVFAYRSHSWRPQKAVRWLSLHENSPSLA